MLRLILLCALLRPAFADPSPREAAEDQRPLQLVADDSSCRFSYRISAQGVPNLNSLPQYVCDYIVARGELNDFNLADSGEQRSILKKMAPEAKQAFERFETNRDQLLKETDPKLAQGAGSPDKTLATLNGFVEKLDNVGINYKGAASPSEFFANSSQGRAGGNPSDYLDSQLPDASQRWEEVGWDVPDYWKFYLKAYVDRRDQLEQAIQSASSQSLAQKTDQLENTPLGKMAPALAKEDPYAGLKRFYDGAASAGPSPSGARGSLAPQVGNGAAGPGTLVSAGSAFSPDQGNLDHGIVSPTPSGILPYTPAFTQSPVAAACDARGLSNCLSQMDQQARGELCVGTGRCQIAGALQAPGQYGIEQVGGTCGIAAQVELLRAHGIEPPTMPEAETRLLNERAYDGSGTPLPAMGRLLQDYGMKVTQQEYYPLSATHPLAGPGSAVSDDNPGDPKLTPKYVPDPRTAATGSLNQAVRRDGSAIVSVDPAQLWNQGGIKGSHAVEVTNEIVDANTGQVKWYVINDSGTGEAGRFVPASVFLRAWSEQNYLLVTAEPPPAGTQTP